MRTFDLPVSNLCRVAGESLKGCHMLRSPAARSGGSMHSLNTEPKPEHVLIVGGSSGMGLALARGLLTDAAEVTIVGRSEARLAQARESLANHERLRT